MRRGGGLIWLLPFIFMFSFHSPGALLFGLIFSVFLMILLRAIFAMIAGARMWNGSNTWYQPPQQTYYTPPQREAVPEEEGNQTYQPYQSYGQGYQPQRGREQPFQYRSAQPKQEPQYEEPQIQYPEELPPMQQ
jgi:hypothetical protein